MYHYKKRFGDYVLLDHNGSVLFSSSEISICYHDMLEGCVLLKHGQPERIQAWYTENINKYKESGLLTESEEIKIVTSSEFDVEDLNMILSNTGYLSVYLKKHLKDPPTLL